VDENEQARGAGSGREDIDALANARFSAESQGFAQFAGPAAIRFESLQVAGEG